MYETQFTALSLKVETTYNVARLYQQRTQSCSHNFKLHIRWHDM